MLGVNEPDSPSILSSPVVLAGRRVRLEPLSESHLPQLIEAGAAPELWAWYPSAVEGAEGMHSLVTGALKDQKDGLALPFALIEPRSGQAIGSSRFGAIERAHRRAEIGWTWVSPAYQRTGVNPEAKLLMLQHAFETEGLVRIEFKTDSLNLASRAALSAIGAVEEGTLRKHMTTHSGRVRHSVYFSITDEDWPQVKRRLLEKLSRSLREP